MRNPNGEACVFVSMRIPHFFLPHASLVAVVFGIVWGCAGLSTAYSEENGAGKPAPKRGKPDGAGPREPGKGFQDGAGPGGGVPSAEERLKVMSEKLGLSAEQQGKVRSIFEKSAPELKALMAKGRDNASEADKEKFRSLMREQMEAIAGVLNPDQREKFKEAMKMRAEGRGGEKSASSGAEAGPGKMEERLSAMKEKLGLSDDQQKKVRAIFEKNAGKMREAFSAGGDKVREVMRAQMEEVGAILTPEQREKMKDLAPKGERRPGGKGKPE